MAESVDALVSNTSGATRAGSTPALGTTKTGEQIFLFACFFCVYIVEMCHAALRSGLRPSHVKAQAYTIGSEWPLIFL